MPVGEGMLHRRSATWCMPSSPEAGVCTAAGSPRGPSDSVIVAVAELMTAEILARQAVPPARPQPTVARTCQESCVNGADMQTAIRSGHMTTGGVEEPHGTTGAEGTPPRRTVPHADRGVWHSVRAGPDLTQAPRAKSRGDQCRESSSASVMRWLVHSMAQGHGRDGGGDCQLGPMQLAHVASSLPLQQRRTSGVAGDGSSQARRGMVIDDEPRTLWQAMRRPHKGAGGSAVSSEAVAFFTQAEPVRPLGTISESALRDRMRQAPAPQLQVVLGRLRSMWAGRRGVSDAGSMHVWDVIGQRLLHAIDASSRTRGGKKTSDAARSSAGRQRDSAAASAPAAQHVERAVGAVPPGGSAAGTLKGAQGVVDVTDGMRQPGTARLARSMDEAQPATNSSASAVAVVQSKSGGRESGLRSIRHSLSLSTAFRTAAAAAAPEPAAQHTQHADHTDAENTASHAECSELDGPTLAPHVPPMCPPRRWAPLCRAAAALDPGQSGGCA